MNRTIKSQWESYLSKVVPKAASSVQRLETQKAFYAGAASFFHLLMEVTKNGGDDDVTEEELAFLDFVDMELKTFFSTVNKN